MQDKSLFEWDKSLLSDHLEIKTTPLLKSHFIDFSYILTQ